MDKTHTLDIEILCKDVDNYGDVGFAYHLARDLSARGVRCADCGVRSCIYAYY